MWKMWVGVMALLSVVGCSGSDDPSPTEKCDTLLTDFCGHAADCIAQSGVEASVSRDQQNNTCLTEARGALSCSKAVAVGSTYSACINDVKAMPCSAFVSGGAVTVPSLPANCAGVIKVTQ